LQSDSTYEILDTLTSSRISGVLCFRVLLNGSNWLSAKSRKRSLLPWPIPKVYSFSVSWERGPVFLSAPALLCAFRRCAGLFRWLRKLSPPFLSRPTPKVSNPSRRRSRPLRIHQRLLQPAPQTLSPRLEITRGLRTENRL